MNGAFAVECKTSEEAKQLAHELKRIMTDVYSSIN